ncbi:uncharacterized protein LOC144134436 [Amblyomma americanum]
MTLFATGALAPLKFIIRALFTLPVQTSGGGGGGPVDPAAPAGPAGPAGPVGPAGPSAPAPAPPPVAPAPPPPPLPPTYTVAPPPPVAPPTDAQTFPPFTVGPPVHTTPTIPTTTTTETTTPTTTTMMPTPPPPLLCSVSYIVAIPMLYPPDKICDIVVYTHVHVQDGKTLAVDSEISYGVFKTTCSVYAETTCGLSFDARYLSVDMFGTTEIRDDLSTLKRQSRVNHYGVLNLYETQGNVAIFAVEATAAFRASC